MLHISLRDTGVTRRGYPDTQHERAQPCLLLLYQAYWCLGLRFSSLMWHIPLLLISSEKVGWLSVLF